MGRVRHHQFQSPAVQVTIAIINFMHNWLSHWRNYSYYAYTFICQPTVVHPDSPALHEIRLSHNHTLTKPMARNYDRKTKLHQIKLQRTQVRSVFLYLTIRNLLQLQYMHTPRHVRSLNLYVDSGKKNLEKVAVCRTHQQNTYYCKAWMS